MNAKLLLKYRHFNELTIQLSFINYFFLKKILTGTPLKSNEARN